jgi:hypothetical protein
MHFINELMNAYMKTHTRSHNFCNVKIFPHTLNKKIKESDTQMEEGI